MPLAVGGGVKTLEDFHWLISSGADKVVLGRIAFQMPSLITLASQKFGAQAVVISIAAENELFEGEDCTVTAADWAYWCQRLGAGEILLQSVERDGTLSGYDLSLIAAVSHAVSIPVIASGGCGTYEHMAEALRAGAHAVAAGAMFQFCDATPQGAAKYLQDCGFNTRVEAA